MKYDFTTIMDRRGMDAIAVDGLEFLEADARTRLRMALTLSPCGWRT